MAWTLLQKKCKTMPQDVWQGHWPPTVFAVAVVGIFAGTAEHKLTPAHPIPMRLR